MNPLALICTTTPHHRELVDPKAAGKVSFRRKEKKVTLAVDVKCLQNTERGL